MEKSLFVDMDICDKCEKCVVDCSYFYHPGNNGIEDIRENGVASFFCRHCEDGSCVQACPEDALEITDEGILKRSSMLCIKCNSCVLACPFGTLLESTINFFASVCDTCIGRANGKGPVCVATCPYDALQFREIDENPEEGIHQLRERAVVHTTAWQRE